MTSDERSAPSDQPRATSDDSVGAGLVSSYPGLATTPEQRAYYPLVFEGVEKETIWGGGELWGKIGRRAMGLRTGEFWEVSGLADGVTKVAAGPLLGLGLDFLAAADPEGLMGQENAGLEFPLLVKLIAAEQDLSVQVHPGDRADLAIGGQGKDEAWYVLHAKPGSRIICGLKPGVTRRRLAAALAGGELLTCLRQMPVATGDFIPIPAGCVHALGAGIVVLELQQSADTTWRLYDWGRADTAGQPRALHVEEGLAAVKASCRPKLIPGWRQRELLYQGKRFRIQRRLEHGARQVTGDPASFRIWSVVQGKLRVATELHEITLSLGQTVLLPAGLSKWHVEGNAVILETKPR